jgi:hypothetical protein
VRVFSFSLSSLARSLLYLCLDDNLSRQINFSANELSWQMIAQLFSSLKTCFEREVPKEPEAEAIASARVQAGLNRLANLEYVW